MREKLKAREVPYLATIFFAGLGWTLSHLVDRIVQSPTVEVRKVSETSGTSKKFSVSLENLSDKVFRGLRFVIFDHDREHNPISNPDFVEPIDGAALGNETPEVKNNEVPFLIAQLQPGWRVSMSVSYSGDSPPKFEMTQGPGTTAIKLVAPSFDTWFTKNEETIMLFMVGAWLLLALVWIFL
jgi:hypothetical protein